MRRFSMILGGSFLLVLAIWLPRAVDADEGTGTITIEQQSAVKTVVGDWTLFKPDNTKITVEQKRQYNLSSMPAGNYTLSFAKPKATSIELKLFADGELKETTDRPQIVFTMEEGAAIAIHVAYAYTRTGVVGVSSDPPGVPFTLRGPDADSNFTGETPASYENVPEGLYSVTYDPGEGCEQPQAQSDQLVKDSRISFNIVLTCAAMQKKREEEYEKKLQFVTLLVDGEDLVLRDVPLDAWFATFVHTVAKTGIISGYRDKSGNLTGTYGPGNNVTVAQLIKVAHELAGIDETTVQSLPKNVHARGQWFTQYYASAEQQHWGITRDARIKPGRPATRGEVVATILQAVDSERVWPKGKLFNDVKPFTPYASSIETAAKYGIIESTEGSASFRPQAPINRAELAKIVVLAIETFITDSPEFSGESRR